jgi:hypothetical protein
LPAPQGLSSYSLFAPNAPLNGPTALDVADNGVFVIDVSSSLPPEQTIAALQVDVRDAAAKSIAGSLKAVPGMSSSFYWSADAPLPVASYQATISVPSNDQLAATTFELHVKGPVTPLAVPTLTPSEWLTVVHATGDTVTCNASIGCSRGQLSFGGDTVSNIGLTLALQAPPTNGFVDWELAFEPVPGKGQFLSTPEPTGVFNSEQSYTISVPLVFEDHLAEYCVTAKMRDAISDVELRSEPICWKAGTPDQVRDETPLGSCDEPPSAALTARWCALHPSSQLAACASTPSGGVDGNAGGSAGVVPISQAASSEASGCSVSHTPRDSGGWAWLALPLSFAALRRQKRSSPSQR